MPARQKEKREKGKSYGETIAHDSKDCLQKTIEQVKYSPGGNLNHEWSLHRSQILRDL
jgi:hypothetical protein